MKKIERQIDLLRIMVRNPAYRETLRKALDAVARAAEYFREHSIALDKALTKLQDQDDEED
jgi:hypothetical protein